MGSKQTARNLANLGGMINSSSLIDDEDININHIPDGQISGGK
jgi:hypothetical protein